MMSCFSRRVGRTWWVAVIRLCWKPEDNNNITQSIRAGMPRHQHLPKPDNIDIRFSAHRHSSTFGMCISHKPNSSRMLQVALHRFISFAGDYSASIVFAASLPACPFPESADQSR